MIDVTNNSIASNTSTSSFTTKNTLNFTTTAPTPPLTSHQDLNTSTSSSITTHHVLNLTTTLSTTVSKHGGDGEALLYGLSIPIGALILTVIIVLIIFCCRWQKRKRQLQRDLTPYYAYDQAEAEVIDGLVYTSASNSTDMLCVVTDHDGNHNNGEADETMLIEDNHFHKERHKGARLDSVSV